MANNRFNNGYKTVVVLLQMVFLIIVVVTVSLMLNIFGRSRLSFRDIGNNYSFFDSNYYIEEFSEELKSLTVYLQMQKGMQERELNELENVKYKRYRLKYDSGESNIYYWFSQKGRIYTNMKDVPEKKDAIQAAEQLGSYLYYEDASVSLSGNLSYLDRIANLEVMRLFQAGHGGELVVAVDTDLPKADAIMEAASIYETYFPWLGVGLFAAVLSFMWFILCMIYLTLATGRNGEEDRIRLHRIDYIPTELHFLAIFTFVTGLIVFCARLGDKDWGVSSSLILTGTLVFLSDGALLALYLSLVRKLKAEIFTSCSLMSFMIRTLKAGMRRQNIAKRAMIQFTVCMGLELFFVWKAFAKQSLWAAAGVLILFLYLAVYFLQQAIQRKKILEGIHEISHGRLDYHFESEEFSGDYRDLAEEINGIGEGLMNAVEENVKNERLKTELVTNVSHDIKTPLTSIINYISLIKMEGSWNENVENYVGILEKKSQRLKQLTEDLVEVSKITSGTIMLDMHPINMVELICQTGGEFNEIFEDVGLTVVTRLPNEPVMILADGSRLWRVVQNLYNNVAKYALKNTRVFVDLKENEGRAEFTIKDISAQSIHKTAQDLSERFVRGDESRGTEGHGLGLSIARHLTNLMGGTFEIQVDGDLFIVTITFSKIAF